MNLIIIITMALICVGCARENSEENERVSWDLCRVQSEGVVAVGPETLPGIVKSDFCLSSLGTEGNLFKWKGQTFLMLNQRAYNETYIINIETNELVVTIKNKFSFPALHVNDDVAYFYGTPTDEINKMYVQTSKNLRDWSSPDEILSAPHGTMIINPSITEKDGAFYMVWEEWPPEKGIDGGFVRFAHSQDLMNWNVLDAKFDNDAYAGGPTLVFSEGYFYLMYLNRLGKHFPDMDHPMFVDIARSGDLVNWEKNKSQYAPFSPKGRADEMTNNSDAEMIETAQGLVFVYFVGDQKTRTDVKIATFEGSKDQFLKRFF